jgi:putative peptide zinc metalloprotease protein
VYGFGMTNAQPVSSLPGERFFLALYGVASQIYKVLIMISIAFFIARVLPTIGFMIAAWSVVAWAFIPTGKFLHWLATSPALHEHRTRAISVTVAAALILILPVGMIPAAQDRRVDGVVESQARSSVAVQSDGFVRQVLVEAGDHVEKGQVLLVMENHELLARKRELAAQVAEARIDIRMALVKDPVERQIARAKLVTLESDLRDAEERIGHLVVRSPQSGGVVGGIFQQWVGKYLQRGQVVASIEDTSNLRVTALVDQAQNALGFFDKIGGVELRTVSRIRRVVPSEVMRIIDAGQTELPHPALGYQGGGKIATTPEDRYGQTAVRPQFHVWLKLPPTIDARGRRHPGGKPGERVYVRFILQERSPLLFQWFHAARQLLRERFEI